MVGGSDHPRPRSAAEESESASAAERADVNSLTLAAAFRRQSFATFCPAMDLIQQPDSVTLLPLKEASWRRNAESFGLTSSP